MRVWPNLFGFIGLIPILLGQISFATQADFTTFFASELKELHECLATDPRWESFRALPEKALLFLLFEKKYTYLESSTRLIVDSARQKVLSGHIKDCKYTHDDYRPQLFRPFLLKGLWVPESEGSSYAFAEGLVPAGFSRVQDGTKHILFLVHPKSEALYAPLLARFDQSAVSVPALALSSFRTLLVALPPERAGEAPIYTMVKVSLDESTDDVLRHVSQKETAGSVATSWILQQRQIPGIDFLYDEFGFAPKAEWLSPHGQAKGAGMLVRPLPHFLTDPQSQEFCIPVFSLFGSRYAHKILDFMLAHSGNMTPTELVRELLLKPYVQRYVQLIFKEHVSIEAHGQNLMLIWDLRTGLPKKDRPFVYRDMGGVNTLLTEEQLTQLPAGLGHKDYFYFDTHYRDVAKSLEDHFALGILFSLNKLFVKSHYAERDPQFAAWYQSMKDQSLLGNWTKLGSDDDQHETKLLREEYCFYGYFEAIFADLLYEECSQKGILRRITSIPGMSEFFHYRTTFATAAQQRIPQRWFEKFSLDVYELYNTAHLYQ